MPVPSKRSRPPRTPPSFPLQITIDAPVCHHKITASRQILHDFSRRTHAPTGNAGFGPTSSGRLSIFLSGFDVEANYGPVRLPACYFREACLVVHRLRAKPHE